MILEGVYLLEGIPEDFKEGRLFAYEYEGIKVYPSFQFDKDLNELMREAWTQIINDDPFESMNSFLAHLLVNENMGGVEAPRYEYLKAGYISPYQLFNGFKNRFGMGK